MPILTDMVTIMSGTEFGYTLGTPIGLFVPNEDQRPGDYKEMSMIPRPGHADFTYQIKYGTRASSGGGRSSARETIGRVAAGAIAEKWLAETYGTTVSCWVSSIGDVVMPESAVALSSGGRVLAAFVRSLRRRPYLALARNASSGAGGACGLSGSAWVAVAR